jgi:carboxypeptidase Q
MSKFIMLTFVFYSISLSQTHEKINWDVVNKILDESFNNSQVVDLAWYLSDGIGPKLTNSKNIKRAQEWIIKTLKGWNLKNVKLEDFGEFGKEWDSKKYSAELISPYYERLIAYPKAWSQSTNGIIEDTLVLVEIKNKEDLDAFRGKLKNKIVIKNITHDIPLREGPEAVRMTDEDLQEMVEMMSHSSSSRYPEFLKPYQQQISQLIREHRKLQSQLDTLFRAEGVAAIVSIDRRKGRHGTVFSSGSRAYMLNQKDGLPEFEMSQEHYMRLVEMKKRGLNPKIRLEMMNEISQDNTVGRNILAEIPGKGKLKNEIVLIGAHYDSWHFSTGATDNTAGTVVMMEAMRIIQNSIQKDKSNRRMIRIGLWSGEEQGLKGARGYVKKHLVESKMNDGKRTYTYKDEFEKISAYYNLDTGGGKIRGLWIEGNAAVEPIFKDFLMPFHDYGAETLTMDPTYGTDHVAFDRAGIPGFTFIQDELEYWTRTHHTSQDNFYRLQADDLKQAAAIVASFAYHTAVRKDRLPRKSRPE